MIIGILLADELADEVIKRYGGHADMVQGLLQPVDEQLKFKAYQTTQCQLPDSIDDCDAYIIPGSKFSAYDNFEWIKQLSQFIVELHKQQKKLIGICFGHQLIAQALGGKTEAHAAGWGVGVMASNISKHENWMQPDKKSYSLVISHHDQVTVLPENAELIAENDFCPVSGFKLSNSIITFQGHPEFSNEYLEYIMQTRRELMGEHAYQEALSSMHNATDREIVAQWIVNFIKQ